MLVGRKTFQATAGQSGRGVDGMKVVVFSRTLNPADHPGVTIVGRRSSKRCRRAMHHEPGKDIWLFGGGELFRSLLDLGLVDTVEVGVIPVAARRRHSATADTGQRAKLTLMNHRVYPKTGTVSLEYAVRREKPGSREARKPGSRGRK